LPQLLAPAGPPPRGLVVRTAEPAVRRLFVPGFRRDRRAADDPPDPRDARVVPRTGQGRGPRLLPPAGRAGASGGRPVPVQQRLRDEVDRVGERPRAPALL